MSYAVKEIFYTLQGEGAQAGRPAVFCRFAGCNLWNGLEEDRSRAVCRFCDTDFVGVDGLGGGRFASAEDLADDVARAWPSDASRDVHPYVVCTGGEPLLQLDDMLVETLHAKGFEVAIETNGTCLPPKGIDWICVSPKAGADLILRSGNELKLVFPQPGAEPHLFEHLAFDNFYLQPMSDAEIIVSTGAVTKHWRSSNRLVASNYNTDLAIQYCKKHPRWRLSVQMHKLLGIP